MSMHAPLRLTSASLVLLLLASCSQTASGPKNGGAPPGDGHPCTEIGCESGLHLSWGSAPWKPGAYSVEVTVDGGSVTCSGRLPLPACEEGPGFHCGPGPSIRLGESGCALPQGQQGLAGIDLDTMPARAKIVVRRDGEEVLTRELAPSYRETQPNGPDCGPVCRQASDTLPPPR